MAYDMKYSIDDSVGLSWMAIKNVESPGVRDPFKEPIVPDKEVSINVSQLVKALKVESSEGDCYGALCKSSR